MQYAVSIPPFGDYADAQALANLAREAEQAGWDGFFLWDHIVFDPSWHPIVDPWIALAAIAVQTTRIRLGTMITPIARRRPWKLARETVSLDRLSGGRLILGVGLGDPVRWDFAFFGEEDDAGIRAQRLDEGLDVLTGLWSGEPFTYQGDQYQLQEVVFRPSPLQQPRIPIWVGGWWPNKRPARRAARWDGFYPAGRDAPLTPEDWRAILSYIRLHRPDGTPCDAVGGGRTEGADRARDADVVTPYAEAGVTWWVEEVNPWRFGWQWEDQWAPEATRLMAERVRRGPPRG